jgi:diguanylate cyclase (GGDEF)-like protein
MARAPGRPHPRTRMKPTPGDNPQLQFVFVSEGRLKEVPTVRHLLRFQRPIYPEDSCQAVLDRFLEDRAVDALPVVDRSHQASALVVRKNFIEFFSKPYSREIFGRRSVLDLLKHDKYENIEPIIVEDTRSVEDVAKMVIDAGMEYMVTGFIVSSAGRYLGIANGHDLLNAITQRKQAELYYLAHYDALTEIPNRTLLADRLEMAIREAKRKNGLVALLFVDVDRFKQINDSLGHAAGDAVLRQVVERLKSIARSCDTVARLGGDEFVLLIEDMEDVKDAELVARRLVESMHEPITLLGHSLIATISVGCAIYPLDDVQSSPLLAKADAAMYEAKAGGRNNFRRYSPDTTLYNPARMTLENDLRQAIEQDQLMLCYQPQVDLASHSIRGVEALVRWCHPVRGIISPMQFIPIAEESGLIVPLGEWVLRHALRQHRMWRDEGIPEFRMSINISARQVQQPGFTEFLAAQLAEHGVEARLVELELTESMLMQDVEAALETLSRIKKLGVTLAVDDFGTGFSSLSYLQRFPIDRLKIDQSFVRNIESTPANESIARAIIALAESLALETVAEGIENPSEMAVLKHLRCPEGQGYLFAKPLSAEDVANWVKAGERAV